MTKKDMILLCVLIFVFFLDLLIMFNLYFSQVELQKTVDTQKEMLYNKDVQISEMTKVISGQEKRLIEAYDMIKSLDKHKKESEKNVSVRITHYSSDETGSVITASGKEAVVGRTVACNFLPLGTHVLINGNEYIVEDTGGMNGNVVDIYVNSSEEALRLGTYDTMMEVL